MEKRYPRARVLVAPFLLASALVLAGCHGEDRPGVTVIGGGGTVSISASDTGPGVNLGPSTTSSNSAGGARYTPLSNVDVYLAMALDLRDMKALMAPAAQGQPVDWAAVGAIYDLGKNQVAANGSVRPFARQPNAAVHAIFPNGPAVYGRDDFINALVHDGINGTGRAAGQPDAVRAQVVEKGVLMLFYGTAVQELTASKTRLSTNAANAAGPVDETWAIVAGAPDSNQERSYSLLALAADLEKDFKLEGRIGGPLESFLATALSSAQKTDGAAFARAFDPAVGYMNTIYYLAVLRAARSTEKDTTPAARQVHLTEAWGYYQTLKAAVAAASPSATQTLDQVFNRSANDAFPASATMQVYAALNDTAVLQALQIPAALQVKSPPE